MNTGSITSTESFLGRAQRSEAARVRLWIVVLTALLLLTFTRRAMHGSVMSNDAIFYPYAGVLVAALMVQVGLLVIVGRANRLGQRLPNWLWFASATFDLSVAGGLLAVSALWSPRGPIAALTSPPLLLMPLVVLLSILRLRPMFTLLMGLAGAAIHLGLAVRAVTATHSRLELVYLSYGVILALTGVAGMFVAVQVRGHVREAAEEAGAHERAERQVHSMNRDLAVARDIQRGLLPARPPSLAGFDIDGMNRPADQTGGDYYDWQPLPDGRLAVVLADVSGHGIGPALVMAVCRAYARASAPVAPDPGAMLTRLNDLIHGDLPQGRFITFVVGVLDEAGDVQLVSAGHGPTLLYRAEDSSIVRYSGDGMPLGVSQGERYGCATQVRLEEGDVMVMLTDGFFEWSREDGQSFGIPRLEEALRGAARADAAGILRAIDGAVRGFCDGSPQADDMTAIVVKRTNGVRVAG